MKRLISLTVCVILLFSCCIIQTNAANEDNFIPYVVDFSFVNPSASDENEINETRATGLISSYSLNLSASGNTLKIVASTYCIPDVVKSGFKDFVVQRKKATSSTWSDYYDYGDMFDESYASSIVTTLVVASGYQYRLTCKHYAKKSLLVTQNISNTSNVVAV